MVQAFNGLKPGDCPDVGLRLGPPDDESVPGEGATADESHRARERNAGACAPRSDRGAQGAAAVHPRGRDDARAPALRLRADGVVVRRVPRRGPGRANPPRSALRRVRRGGGRSLLPRCDLQQRAAALHAVRRRRPTRQRRRHRHDGRARRHPAGVGGWALLSAAQRLAFGLVRRLCPRAVHVCRTYGDGGLCNGIVPGTEDQ